MLKFTIYLLSSILIIWSFDAVNINVIFKKNKVVQARVFYFILVFILIYLFSSFLYDFIYLKLF